MRIKPFQALYPNLDYITSADSFFDAVREEYPDYYRSGFFSKASREALFIYQIKSRSQTNTGLLASADIKDFLDGKIKKHEQTIAAREQKQMQLMLNRSASVKPVLLIYSEVPSISRLISSYAEDHEAFLNIYFEEEQQNHLLWEIKDRAAINALQQLFESEVPDTFIADGHHRVSTTALLYKRRKNEPLTPLYDSVFCAFFPTCEVAILDFNRVVDGLSDCSITTFMARLSQLFEIDILDKPVKPRQKHEITMFVNREWFSLRWKKEVLKKYEAETVILDSLLLNEEVIRPILGIRDFRTDHRIEYVEGPRGLEGIRKSTLKNDSSIGFCLYPVQMDELLQMARAGKMLPPKSTWFEPRMKNGLIVQAF